jgi:phosphoribosylamine--glycine ligase
MFMAPYSAIPRELGMTRRGFPANRAPMNVLLIGAGGREHALAWKIAQSPRLTKLFAAPGNPGIAEHAELAAIDVGDHAAVVAFCRAHAIDLVVVGPEGPLVAGIVDDLAAAGIAAFGPTREAARLEGSKAYTKAVCDAAGIPTAAYGRFTSAAEAVAYAKAMGAPIVVKADGLAAGKGVTIATTVAEATDAIAACFAGVHGVAGAEVVIEECLVGEEASFFVLSDGENVVPLATAQDHKRAHDGDTGPNTGGMGAYSPAPAMTPALIDRTLREIVRPTIAAMATRGAPFRGVLYAGLMLTADGPKLIEYNVRFGDPEAQVLMMRLDSDLLPLLAAAASGSLAGMVPKWTNDSALTVVMAAEGYPGPYVKGSPIGGVARANALPGVKVFHAGTAQSGATLVSAGGRVLDVTARAATIREAQMRAYDAVAHIDWPGGVFRRDIGRRAVVSRG